MIFHLNLPLQSKKHPEPLFLVEGFPFKKKNFLQKNLIRSPPGAFNFLCKISINNLPVKVRPNPTFRCVPLGSRGYHRLDQASSQALVMPCTAIMALSCNDLSREFSNITWNNPEPTQNNPSMLHKWSKTYIININIYINLYTYWYYSKYKYKYKYKFTIYHDNMYIMYIVYIYISYIFTYVYIYI